MSAIETFQFGRYTLRPANPFDRSLARRWTQADPHHAHVDPEFWTDQKYGHDAYLLFDGEEPLFFFKLILFEPAATAEVRERWCEMHIQFAPEETNPERRRLQTLQVMTALRHGYIWLERVLLQVPIQVVFFDSVSESLVAFCVRYLGFKQEGARLHKRLTTSATPAGLRKGF